MAELQLYDYNLQEIKENLTLEEVAQILDEYNAEPEIKENMIISRTIDHNYIDDSSASRKLYYYDNSHLFVSWTRGDEPFDIFQLVLIVENREHNAGWELPQAVAYVAQKFGYAANNRDEVLKLENIDEFKVLHDYERIKEIKPNTQEVQLEEYDGSFLKNMAHPLIVDWVNDNITEAEMQRHEICYDAKNQGIVIPHRDIDGRLIGIRERTLIQENADLYGKYRPAYISGKLYNHPLSFALYNLCYSKENIKRMKKAIIFESEKSCMQYSSMFGAENDITAAICGSNFGSYQAWLLINLGVEEAIIGLDKQFKEKGDLEFQKLVRNLKNIYYKYGNYFKISFLWDKDNILDYKSSPTDEGRDKFLKLFKERIYIYG
jgi:hypothetical protein